MPGTIGIMANTSSRTLRLLSLLQNHRFWPGTELAERLGVSPRTLRRDVDRLRELGYPVTAQPGVDGGYQLASGAALPPLVVDDEEAVALAVGLRLATQGAGQDSTDPGTVAEAAARALAKVTQVMPARLRRRVEAVAAMTESASWDPARAAQAAAINPDVLASAALACRDAERVRFSYGAAKGERTERHVEPHRLVALDRRWYLVAYDLTRNDWRSFRLDRIISVPQPTGAMFRPRTLPAADAAEFVRRNITALPGTWQVKVVIEAPAAVIRGRIGRWAKVEEDGPGRCVMTMKPGDNLDWPVIALGMAGADFRVLSPPELAERIADWGDRFTRATRPLARAKPEPLELTGASRVKTRRRLPRPCGKRRRPRRRYPALMRGRFPSRAGLTDSSLRRSDKSPWSSERVRASRPGQGRAAGHARKIGLRPRSWVRDMAASSMSGATMRTASRSPLSKPPPPAREVAGYTPLLPAFHSRTYPVPNYRD
jgi:predicted DNA-binding transcriptional regulator YafY